MLRKSTLLAALAVSFLSTPSYSEEWEVLILEDAYFPPISYASVGDTLLFRNDSESTVTIAADDASWTLDRIAVGGTASLPVSEDMALNFHHDGVTDDEGNLSALGSIELVDEQPEQVDVIE